MLFRGKREVLNDFSAHGRGVSHHDSFPSDTKVIRRAGATTDYAGSQMVTWRGEGLNPAAGLFICGQLEMIVRTSRSARRST